jgi:hypothetical protein
MVQFDSRRDRASSDFDQRQNLVFSVIWTPPMPRDSSLASRLLRDWQLSSVGAFRAGSPYSIYAATPQINNLLNNRASLIAPQLLHVGTGPTDGGKTLLNQAAFEDPGSQMGNLGRNAFTGPTAYNIDVSVSRSFRAPRIREGARVIFRADAFNVFNHANLNNPDLFAATCCISASYFTYAQYGRQGRSSGLPVFAPFNETPRQIQLLFRLEF